MRAVRPYLQYSNPDHYFGVDKPPVIVLGPDKNPGTPQYVTVVNSESGEILTRFVAYEADYLGGTRVTARRMCVSF